MRQALPHVVIVGGGFAGLAAVRALRAAPVRITLVDRGNHHLFQPMLYQVATAGLSAPDIAAPLRQILRRQKNVVVRMATVARIEAADRCLELAGGERVAFDYLLLASGSTQAYFGNDHWAAHAPGLETLDDALDLRRRLLLAFERAESATDPAERDAWLSFAVVGGRAHRRRTGRHPGRDRTPHTAGRVPQHRSGAGPGPPGRGRAAGPGGLR